jgi:hypothetical protein
MIHKQSQRISKIRFSRILERDVEGGGGGGGGGGVLYEDSGNHFVAMRYFIEFFFLPQFALYYGEVPSEKIK